MKKSELVALLDGLEDGDEVTIHIDVDDDTYDLALAENNRTGDGEIFLTSESLDKEVCRLQEVQEEDGDRDRMLDAALDILWRDAGVTEGDLAMAAEYAGDPVDYLAKLLGRVK